MADDLDSFFQEINQVTASAESENSAYDLNADNNDESSANVITSGNVHLFIYSNPHSIKY